MAVGMRIKNYFAIIYDNANNFKFIFTFCPIIQFLDVNSGSRQGEAFSCIRFAKLKKRS
jgi:hypothetical protein